MVLVVNNSPANAGDVRDASSIPELEMRRRKWQLTPGFLPGESHGQRSLVGYSPLGHKESGSTERLNHNKGAQERRKVRGREGPLGVRNQPGNREETS